MATLDPDVQMIDTSIYSNVRTLHAVSELYTDIKPLSVEPTVPHPMGTRGSFTRVKAAGA